MTNYIVKTHKPGTVYAKPHFFVLNKGLNSGKPQKTPYVNCFVIQFSTSEDCENFYWISQSLWLSKFWHQFLKGSVIPFVTLDEFKKEFNSKSRELMEDFEAHQKAVKALRLLHKQEQQFHANINLINDLKRTILQRYCRK
ncbi:DUF6943 family protein [Flavobacterium enshiense]|uniref:Uncharacterized protein n=1 Tax=Flavobacterium enshiense DK69 TaxID=1107311 RepID=A0A0A2N5H3_9FLAO|nr:hypothetical protein [Flavobacterium enshiense]KGO95660.1 hypothetical protein Q767_10605 [Flavobacterium enshiense DK69]